MRIREREDTRLTASTLNFIFHTSNWQDCLLQHETGRVMLLANPVKLSLAKSPKKSKVFFTYLWRQCIHANSFSFICPAFEIFKLGERDFCLR